MTNCPSGSWSWNRSVEEVAFQEKEDVTRAASK